MTQATTTLTRAESQHMGQNWTGANTQAADDNVNRAR